MEKPVPVPAQPSVFLNQLFIHHYFGVQLVTKPLLDFNHLCVMESRWIDVPLRYRPKRPPLAFLRSAKVLLQKKSPPWSLPCPQVSFVSPRLKRGLMYQIQEMSLITHSHTHTHTLSTGSGWPERHTSKSAVCTSASVLTVHLNPPALRCCC